MLGSLLCWDGLLRASCLCSLSRAASVACSWPNSGWCCASRALFSSSSMGTMASARYFFIMLLTSFPLAACAMEPAVTASSSSSPPFLATTCTAQHAGSAKPSYALTQVEFSCRRA